MTQSPEKRLVTDARLPNLIDTPTAALIADPTSATALAVQELIEQLPSGITAVDDGDTISFYASTTPSSPGGGSSSGNALTGETGNHLTTESGDLLVA